MAKNLKETLSVDDLVATLIISSITAKEEVRDYTEEELKEKIRKEFGVKTVCSVGGTYKNVPLFGINSKESTENWVKLFRDEIEFVYGGTCGHTPIAAIVIG